MQNGLRTGRSVRDDHVAVESEQRRSAMRFRIHAPFDGAESVPSKERADLAFGISRQLFAQPFEQAIGQSLATFEDDVADKPVANDHIHPIVEKIFALDVADEMERKFLAELKVFARRFISSNSGESRPKFGR